MYLHFFFKQSLMCPTQIFDNEKEIDLVNVLHLKTIKLFIFYIYIFTEGSTVVTLEDVFIFATGTNSIPPLGLLPSPILSFLLKDEEDGQSKFPIANTCANQLKLPIHSSYDLFKENVEFGILNSPNFGRA